jgi:hypothetical protein
MNTIIKKFKKKYGYSPSPYELHSLYTQGALILSDKEEDAILEYFEKTI